MFAVTVACATGQAAPPCEAFHPGQLWLDDRGTPINAHGGGVLFDKATGPMHALSTRELEVLDCLRRSLTNAETAKAIGISDHAVKHHVKAVIDKLEAADRTEAVARAFELGLLS